MMASGTDVTWFSTDLVEKVGEVQSCIIEEIGGVDSLRFGRLVHQNCISI